MAILKIGPKPTFETSAKEGGEMKRREEKRENVNAKSRTILRTRMIDGGVIKL